MVDTCHYTFVQNYRIYNPKSESECNLWILLNNNVPIWLVNYSKCTSLMQNNNRATKGYEVANKGTLYTLKFLNLNLFLK